MAKAGKTTFSGGLLNVENLLNLCISWFFRKLLLAKKIPLHYD
jgi:hypothetical protein